MVSVIVIVRNKNQKRRTPPHAAQAAQGASKAGADDFLEEATIIIHVSRQKHLKVRARTPCSLLLLSLPAFSRVSYSKALLRHT